MAPHPHVRSAWALAVLVLFAASARASVIWRGDFSTGDLSQWSSMEEVSTDRLRVVPDPLGAARDVLRATVVDGDNPIDSSGNRNELLYTGDDVAGQERWYRWQTLWPADYATEDTWQVFTQWHQYEGGGSPPVEFFAWGDAIYLRVQLDNPDGSVWSAPLERGKWHDFVFHVRWSSDASVGYVELWYDGKLVVARHDCATLFPGTGVYLKQGLYRNDTIIPTQTIFHAGMVVGTTLDDVVPPPAAEVTTAIAPAPSAPAATTSTPAAVSTSGTASEGAQPITGRAGCDEAGSTAFALLFVLAALALRRRRARGVAD